jgi:uncharacterized protein (DUF2062 family)
LSAVLTIKESPNKIALSFSIGVFIGMSPLVGLHTILGLAIASIFRLNKFVTIIGVYITNPWTIVPIYTFSTFVGAKLLGLKKVIPDIDWHNLGITKIISELKDLLIPFVVGTLFVGTLSAIISFIILYHIVRNTRKNL